MAKGRSGLTGTRKCDPRLTRRTLLAGAAGLAGSAMTPGIHFAAARAADGFFEITAGPGKYKLYSEDAADSDLWLYDGGLPGPEIRVKRGERVKVRLINALEEATSIHWHGVRIDNAMDGVSGLTQDPVPPGGTFDYDFVAPDAGTYWYHAHNKSWNQVGRGLYGPLIVEEEEPVFDRDHDLMLIMDDWRLNDDGRLDTESFGSLMDWSHGGRLGNWLTVNGKSNPSFALKAGEAYRIRLVNASNARVLELDPDSIGGQVIGYDGQVLTAAERTTAQALVIAPAQRVDLVVVPEAGRDLALVEVSTSQRFTFAEFKVSGEGEGTPPERLPQANILAAPDLSKAKRVVLDMTGGAMGQMGPMRHKGRMMTRDDIRATGQVWAFNGVANVDEQPLFEAARGETILLETVNNTAWPHAIHLHGHHFRTVGADGALGPWRDTFLIERGETIRVAFQADNPGKWLLHCHMLEHAAAGMTTWISVT
jgi:FtsP/CotA-like multicopper oxidase with cupredoxin domain